MTPTSLETLIELARAATPGPWKRGNAGCVWNDGYKAILAEAADANNACFIAATNPATVIALCEALRGAVAALEKQTGTYSDPLQDRERAYSARRALARIAEKVKV